MRGVVATAADGYAAVAETVAAVALPARLPAVLSGIRPFKPITMKAKSGL